jgi:hypothetical protein
MIAVSALPTAEELAQLALLVPSFFRLRLDGGHVLMTMFDDARSPAKPLVTYEIVPRAGHDYAGTALGALLAELAAQTRLAHRAARDSSASDMLRILSIVNDSPQHANRAAAADGTLVARTKLVHTSKAADWFPPA